MIDYHLHTLFCNHATGGMERYIQSAVNLGLREICFLDHLTIRKAKAALSMTPEEVPYYFHAVQVLKQKYRNKISVKAGLELDFNPEYIVFIQDIIQHPDDGVKARYKRLGLSPGTANKLKNQGWKDHVKSYRKTGLV